MLSNLPTDDSGYKMQIVPQSTAKQSGIVSVWTGATAFVPNPGKNNFLRMYAPDGNVFLKYGAGVAIANNWFDEIIPQGQVVDIVYNNDELPGDYSFIADVATNLYYTIK